MKHLKKLISGLLMAALLVSCLAGIPALRLEASAATVASGTCGNNLTWVLDDAGTLTISGTGPMANYISVSDQPWYNYNSIKSVVIKKGVTSIGDYAFDSFYYLSTITIPDSVTSIGDHAFSNCIALTSLQVAKGNPVYHSAGNCIIETKGKTLIAGCKSSQIPADGSVTNIGSGAFAFCKGLTSITIPDSVTSIGESAFSWCSDLTEVHISNLDAWCNISFYDSYSNPLRYAGNLYLNGQQIRELEIPNDVTNIKAYAFFGCSSLTSIIIPDSVTSIGAYAFNSCEGLTSITIPDSVTSIDSCAFRGCTGLTSITIPGSVTSIGNYAFDYCNKLTDVYITDPSAWCKIDFGDDGSTSRANPMYYADELHIVDANGNEVSHVVLDNTVTSIPSFAFEGCSSLTSITIPSNVIGIGQSAFDCCTGLTSITIPDSATSIGYAAFRGCTRLKEISFDGSAPAMGSSMFYNVTATAYYYPDETWTEDVMQNYGGTIAWVPKGVSISYSANGDAGDPITIEIFPQGSQTAAHTFTNKDTLANTGTWSIKGVTAGTYTVKVTKKNHVTQEYPLTVGNEAAALNVELWLLGDVNGDGKVNFSDYGKVLAQAKGQGSLEGYASQCADVNGDGRINFSDYGKVLSQAKGNHTLW